MNIQERYSFAKGQSVPAWLYSVLDSGAAVPCHFGVAGGAALTDEGQVFVWPGVDRQADEYVFVIDAGFLANAWAGHPAGDEKLQVLPTWETAQEVVGEGEAVPLPNADPREAA